MLSVNGGPDIDVVFGGPAASVAAGTPGPYALVDGMTLQLRIDGGAEQHVTFAASDFVNVAQATGAEVAAAINASVVRAKAVRGADVRIVSDPVGTSSRVEVT